MAKSRLREAPFAFMDLLHATANKGTCWRISGADVRYACGAPGCEATFEQTEDGWRALSEHQLAHGRGTVVDLAELDGLTLRIVTWAVGSSYGTRPEIWGIDEERGLAYHLSNAYQGETVWKWRIKSGHSGALAALNAAMPIAQD